MEQRRSHVAMGMNGCIPQPEHIPERGFQTLRVVGLEFEGLPCDFGDLRVPGGLFLLPDGYESSVMLVTFGRMTA